MCYTSATFLEKGERFVKKITIKDVASHAGISKTTVSRVLNRRGYISETMYQKVDQSIRELGFIPNDIARSFFKARTKQVGVIVSAVANPFFGELVFHIEKTLFRQGYKMTLCNSINEKCSGKDYLRMLQESRVDGIIACSHHISIDDYNMMPLKMISIERKINDDIPIVQSDNYSGGKIATEALIQAGCKQILCINGEISHVHGEPAYDRVLGYLDCVRENGLEAFVERIPFVYNDPPKHERIKHILMQKVYDGVFAGDDVTAAMVFNHAAELGIPVPERLKIVGFDGTSIVRDIFPSLATVQQSTSDLAEIAVALLLKEINDCCVPKRTVLPVRLVRGRTLGDE